MKIVGLSEGGGGGGSLNPEIAACLLTLTALFRLDKETGNGKASAFPVLWLLVRMRHHAWH